MNRNGSYDNSNKYELIKRLIALSLTEDPDPADASEKKQIELYFDIRVSIDTDKKITFYKGDESFGSDKFDQFFDSFEWERQYELANKFFLGIDTNYNFGKFFIIKEGDLTYFKKLNQDLIEIDKSMIPQIYAQLDLDQQGEVNKILDEIDKGKYKGSPKISYENTNQYKVNNVTKNLKDVLAYLSFKQSRQNPSDFDMNLEAHLDYP
ncbi:MAG: hypothetical protein VW397_08520, partial [Candidatus Margulisiibacteriota bacterium]